MLPVIEKKPVWGDPGISEVLQLPENTINMPASTGGRFTRSIQRAGLLKTLRFYLTQTGVVTGYSVAPSKSVLGVLGANVDRIQVSANGQTALYSLSGLMAQVYNEIQNRDGSVLANAAYQSGTGMVAGAQLQNYDAIGANGTFTAKFPFEFRFGLPLLIEQQISELGLWLLQNQSVDLNIDITFNNPYSAAASVYALWSGGTLTYTPTLASSTLQIERELYTIPDDPDTYPNLQWAHQVIEYSVPITGGRATFPLPRAGVLLRAAVMNLDANDAPVEITDVSELAWQYGGNEKPVSRAGWSLAEEWLMDYGRMAPKGVGLLDFYKWGGDGLKFVKNTEDLANLQLNTTFTATTTGTQRILIDRLMPVSAM